MTKRQIVHSACIVGIMASAILGFWQTQRILYNGRTVVLSCDPYVAPTLHAHIKQTIEDCLRQEPMLNVHLVLQKLQQSFPAITGITMNYHMPGIVTLRATYARPTLLVKKVEETPLILAEHGLYISSTHYDAALLEGLPSLLVTESDFREMSQRALRDWFRALPRDFFLHYNAQWKKPTEIFVRDPASPHATYIITSTTAWTPILEEQCKRARGTLPVTHKKYKKWIIDARFKNQLIIKGVL